MTSLSNIPTDPLCCIIVIEEYYETTIAVNMQPWTGPSLEKELHK